MSSDRTLYIHSLGQVSRWMLGLGCWHSVCGVCATCSFSVDTNVVHQSFTDTLVTVLCKRTPAWCDGTVYFLGPALSIGWSSMQCSFHDTLPSHLPASCIVYICMYVYVCVFCACVCMLCVCVFCVKWAMSI